jgi:hypothetical protein
MPLAEWSVKTTVENQDDMRLPAKIGKADGVATKISQFEIGSGGIQGYFWHWLLL